MQIILVSRAGKVPRTLDLANQRLRWRVLGIGATVVLALASLGAGVALAVASPRDRASNKTSNSAIFRTTLIVSSMR
jgi:hypothetical protein